MADESTNRRRNHSRKHKWNKSYLFPKRNIPSHLARTAFHSRTIIRTRAKSDRERNACKMCCAANAIMIGVFLGARLPIVDAAPLNIFVSIQYLRYILFVDIIKWSQGLVCSAPITHDHPSGREHEIRVNHVMISLEDWFHFPNAFLI